MKKLISILFIVFTSYCTYAQTENNNYIEVIGEVVYERVPEKYSAQIMISKDFCYSYNNESVTFEELKDNFFKKTKEIGISQDSFVENEVEFLANSYRNKGTLYKFTTKNKEEFIKFLKIKSNGIQFRNQMVSFKELSANKAKELKQKALQNARKKAEEYSAITNKKISEIQFVKDYNYLNTSSESIYYTNNPISYKITVAYKMN